MPFVHLYKQDRYQKHVFHYKYPATLLYQTPMSVQLDNVAMQYGAIGKMLGFIKFNYKVRFWNI
ncbi:MAG TPA: hypothetical protein DDX75_06970 [Phycisphaerales bacterium]|nr:hypothetical protein [Phycisphaerales bacterium]